MSLDYIYLVLILTYIMAFICGFLVCFFAIKNI